MLLYEGPLLIYNGLFYRKKRSRLLNPEGGRKQRGGTEKKR